MLAPLSSDFHLLDWLQFRPFTLSDGTPDIFITIMLSFKRIANVDMLYGSPGFPIRCITMIFMFMHSYIFIYLFAYICDYEF